MDYFLRFAFSDGLEDVFCLVNYLERVGLLWQVQQPRITKGSQSILFCPNIRVICIVRYFDCTTFVWKTLLWLRQPPNLNYYYRTSEILHNFFCYDASLEPRKITVPRMVFKVEIKGGVRWSTKCKRETTNISLMWLRFLFRSLKKITSYFKIVDPHI